jgi:hypothetical protein
LRSEKFLKGVAVPSSEIIVKFKKNLESSYNARGNKRRIDKLAAKKMD